MNFGLHIYLLKVPMFLVGWFELGKVLLTVNLDVISFRVKV